MAEPMDIEHDDGDVVEGEEELVSVELRGGSLS